MFCADICGGRSLFQSVRVDLPMRKPHAYSRLKQDCSIVHSIIALDDVRSSHQDHHARRMYGGINAVSTFHMQTNVVFVFEINAMSHVCCTPYCFRALRVTQQFTIFPHHSQGRRTVWAVLLVHLSQKSRLLPRRTFPRPIGS